MRTLILLICFMAQLATATTYYVSTTGTNSNTGLSATFTSGTTGPWLTLTYAVTNVASGDTILVEDGTYAETVVFKPTKVFTSTVLVAGYSGIAANVIIKGTSGNFNTTQSVPWMTYSNLTFRNRGTADTRTIDIENGAHDVKWVNCVITSSNLITMLILAGSVGVVSNITFDTCTFLQESTGDTAGIVNSTGAVNTLVTNCDFRLNGNCFMLTADSNPTIINSRIYSTNTACITHFSGTVQSSGLSVKGCDLRGGTAALLIYQALNATIDTCTNASTGTHVVEFGQDASFDASARGTANNCVVKNCIINCNGASHGIIFGANTTNCLAFKNTINCLTLGTFGIVLKCGLSSGATYNTIYGGTFGCVLFKGFTNGYYAHNIFYPLDGGVAGQNNGHEAVGIQADPGAGTTTDHAFVTNNWFVCNNGPAFYWNTNDAGNSVVDYNAYFFRGAPLMGTHLAVTNTTIESWISGWSGYGVSGNDSHSWYGPTLTPGF